MANPNYETLYMQVQSLQSKVETLEQNLAGLNKSIPTSINSRLNPAITSVHKRIDSESRRLDSRIAEVSKKYIDADTALENKLVARMDNVGRVANNNLSTVKKILENADSVIRKNVAANQTTLSSEMKTRDAQMHAAILRLEDKLNELKSFVNKQHPQEVKPTEEEPAKEEPVVETEEPSEPVETPVEPAE